MQRSPTRGAAALSAFAALAVLAAGCNGEHDVRAGQDPRHGLVTREAFALCDRARPSDGGLLGKPLRAIAIEQGEPAHDRDDACGPDVRVSYALHAVVTAAPPSAPRRFGGATSCAERVGDRSGTLTIDLAEGRRSALACRTAAAGRLDAMAIVHGTSGEVAAGEADAHLATLRRADVERGDAR